MKLVASPVVVAPAGLVIPFRSGRSFPSKGLICRQLRGSGHERPLAPCGKQQERRGRVPRGWLWVVAD
eukprot:2986398-Alexandrium_andersonii.AAC.1